MRIREDSPFYGISEEQKELFLDEAEQLSYLRISEMWEMRTGKETSEGQVKRFLQRLRYERAIRDTDDSPEDLAAFARRAQDGKARDGLIEASRQKLFEEALAKGDQALLLELYKSANEERAREREVAVEQRKARVAEENAKIGWLKVAGGREFLEARMASAEAVIEAGAVEEPKWLPKLREMLTDSGKMPEERLAAALEFLTNGPSGDGVKLIGEGNGPNERATLERGGPGEGEKQVAKTPPRIDWDAPLREAMEELRAYNEREAAKAKAESGDQDQT